MSTGGLRTGCDTFDREFMMEMGSRCVGCTARNCRREVVYLRCTRDSSIGFWRVHPAIAAAPEP